MTKANILLNIQNAEARKRSPPPAVIMVIQLKRVPMSHLEQSFVKRRPGQGTPVTLACNCRWPLGTLREVSTFFCDRAIYRGSYCEQHYDVAYRRVQGVHNMLEGAGK